LDIAIQHEVAQMSDPRRQCERAVRVAANDERTAHKALLDGMRPGDLDWDPSEDQAYRARLARWRTASQALVDALDRLHATLHPARAELPQAGPLRSFTEHGAERRRSTP
jgi:hypothetical protein